MKHFFVILFILTINAADAVTAKFILYKRIETCAVADTDAVVADTGKAVKKQLISVGVNYGSDIQFFGRTGPVKYPYMSTDAIYNFKSGFFVYGSAVQVFGYTPLIDEVDLGTGYLFKYSKAFTGTFSYTHFFFTNGAPPVIISASSNDFNFKNSYNWDIVKPSVTFDYLFGQANDYFVTLNLSKHIEPDWNIFNDQDYLSFNPGVSMISGTQNFVGRYSMENSSQLYFDNYIPGLKVPPPFRLRNDYDNGRFNILNYSFALPISYNMPHYTFEASWKYSIPLNVEGALKNRHELFFYLTFYYLFFK